MVLLGSCLLEMGFAFSSISVCSCCLFVVVRTFVVVVEHFNFFSSVFPVFSLAQDAGQGQVQSVIVFCILFRIKCLLLSLKF